MPEEARWETPQEIVRQEMNALRGRLLTAIESAGLPSGQERALKTLIRNQTFQSQYIFEEIVNSTAPEQIRFRYGPGLEMVRNGVSQNS